jgi:hypothetical protein
MSQTVTVTISPSGANNEGAKWCVVGYSNWLASGASYTLNAGTYTLSYKYVPGYSTPANESITVTTSDLAKTATYGATSWLSTWKPPNCICYFKGQVFTGGAMHTAPDSGVSDARLVMWSEIGAFSFLGATADARKNTAGTYYIGESDSEMVMRIMALKNHVIVFGSYGVYVFEPVSQPAPTYSIKQISKNGIKNPLAVAGNDSELLYVDRYGVLRMILYGQYERIEERELGYQTIFSAMQASLSFSTGVGLISIVYNHNEDEYYLGTATKSYLFNKNGLTELEYAYTSYINVSGSILAGPVHEASTWTAKPMSAVTQIVATKYLTFETEVFDFNVAGRKTITGVYVQGTFGTSAVVYVKIKYRSDRAAALSETSYIRCSPEGWCAPIVTGSDLSICVKVDDCDDVYITGLIVEWQLSDKHSVRGNYVSADSSSSN